MLVAPRTKLADLAKREEIGRTGVYVLSGADPDNPARDIVYVGEGDDVFKRLAWHDKDSSKEFWTRCVAIISKDLNLTKAHVRYLESRLIAMGHAAGRAKLHNGTAPPLPPMPEPDIADMEGFLGHIELMLPVLGFSFLKPKPSAKPTSGTSDASEDVSPVFEFSSGSASARAQEINGEFVVLKGSTATLEPRTSWTSYRKLREQLVEEKRLVEVPGNQLLLFAEDIVFSSPSAGASVVAAGNTNGRAAWRVEGTRQTYEEWHQSRLPTNATRDESLFS